MAKAKKTETEYVSHCTPTEIYALSRCAIKVRDNYYTVECSEKRNISSIDGIDMEKEFELLFDELNSITDSQCQDIISTFTKKGRE